MTAYNAWGMRGGTCEIIGNYMVFMGFYGVFMVLCFLTACCVRASSRIPRHTGKMPHPSARGRRRNRSSSPVSTHTHTQIKLPSAVTHEGKKKIAPAARPVRHTPDRPPGAEKKIGYQTTVTPRPKTAKNRCARARAPRAPLAILGSARGGYLQCMGFMGSYGTNLVPYGD
jgi:hypothetical protein